MSSRAPEADTATSPKLAGAIGWLFQCVPALDAMRTYSWTSLGRDAAAGMTVATVAVPQAMAYAALAGLPPQYGLYTAIVMTGVGALLDSSRQLINGPTNAIAIALLSALALAPESERVSTAIVLAFLVGTIQLGIALLRLGDLTRFVSHSVIVGFTLGAATLLVVDQTKYLLGLEPQGDPADHFLTRFWLSLTTGGGVHVPTMLVAAGTVAVVVAIRKMNSVFRTRGVRFPVPQHLAALVIMGFLVWSFRLDEAFGIKVVGQVPGALPAFQLPEVRWDHCRLFAGSAFAIALLGLFEAVAMAKAISVGTGQKLDVNQQCLSEGAANFVGSFFQCFPGSGSLTRSAVNQQAGAVSQWSGVFAAITVAGTVVLAAPLAAYIPRASLAGLLVLAAYRMVDRRQLLFHLRATRFDAGVVAATAVSAVLISIEFCVVIGVFISFALYAVRVAHVRLSPLTPTPDGGLGERRLEDLSSEQVVAFELEGELFFGAEAELAKHFTTIAENARGEVQVVILVLRRARNPDAAFLHLLKILHERLHARRVTLLLCSVQSDLWTALGASGVATMIGVPHIFVAGDASEVIAVRHAKNIVGRASGCAASSNQSASPAAYPPK